MILGLQDPWVAIAFLLCVLSAALCVVWGLVRWNKEPHFGEEPETEVRKWAEEEDRVEEEL